MSKFTVCFERKVKKRLNEDAYQGQVEYLISRATSGNRKNWSCTNVQRGKPVLQGDWCYKLILEFTRSKEVSDDQLTKEYRAILEFLRKAGESGKFKPSWSIVKHQPSWTVKESIDVQSSILDFDRALDFDEIVIPEVLVTGTDQEIESHPAFSGIYGRAAHIRVIGASIKRTILTKGAKRNHVLLHGLPGCAKSHIVMGWMEVLGKGAYFVMNANSTTRAGVEKMFTDRFEETGVPPICFIEEIEKTQESTLTVWLSILDDRAEVRKINYREQKQQEAKVLAIATANDKVLFDRLHGGRPKQPGALSSRFTKQLYVSRPDPSIMRRILEREIETYGGQEEWIDPCLELAKELETNDPRIVIGFLDGQDRLLDGSYKEDIISIYASEEADGVWVDDDDDDDDEQE